MPGRVIGGIVGWLIGVLPIVGVDAAEYFGFYLPNPELFGALALILGVILGGIVSGYIGGRATGNRMVGGATGASIAGGIASILYIISTVALLLQSASLGVIPSISSGQVLHVAAALLFFAALWLGIAMLIGFLTGRDPAPEEQEGPPPYPQTSLPRYTEAANPGRSSRPVTSRQGDASDYNRYDRSRSSGWPGDHQDSGSSSSRPRYPDR